MYNLLYSAAKVHKLQLCITQKCLIDLLVIVTDSHLSTPRCEKARFLILW